MRIANAIYEVGQPTDRGTTGSWGAALVDAASAVAEWFPDKEKSIAVGFFGTSLGARCLATLCRSATRMGFTPKIKF